MLTFTTLNSLVNIEYLMCRQCILIMQLFLIDIKRDTSNYFYLKMIRSTTQYHCIIKKGLCITVFSICLL